MLWAPPMATARRQGFLSRFLPAGGTGEFFDLFEQHADRTREAAQMLAAMVRQGLDPERQAERVKHTEHLGDEITHAVMRALRAHRTSFDGEDVCNGNVGSAHCGRVLRYVATAQFRGP